MESTREVIQYFFKLMAHLTQGRGTKESSSRMKIREYFLKKKKKKFLSNEDQKILFKKKKKKECLLRLVISHILRI